MPADTPRPPQRPGRRTYLSVALFALALALLPFLFWYNTWFGRRLGDAQLDAYLADCSTPRHIQHALVQVGERISRRQNARRWYPRVIAQAASPHLVIRQTAAWIMGQDRGYPPFHDALRKLILDPETMVRRNAALSLAAFGDAAARPELVAMLRPVLLRAPAAGPLRYRLKLGDYVNSGTLVARVGQVEVRSPAPGEVRALARKEGDVVAPDDALAALSADQSHVWEALRALYVVGQTEDLADVRRFLHPSPRLPEKLARQAALTEQAIQARGKP